MSLCLPASVSYNETQIECYALLPVGFRLACVYIVSLEKLQHQQNSPPLLLCLEDSIPRVALSFEGENYLRALKQTTRDQRLAADMIDG